MTSCRWTILRRLSLMVAVCAVLAMSKGAFSQESKNETPALDAGGKKLAFEVVSIRPSQRSAGAPQFGPTHDGYQLKGTFLFLPIVTAYVPQVGGSALYTPDQLSGLPDWMTKDAYDIDAKVDEADLADWHDPVKQPAMLRAMLQSMLADRLKLAVHRSSKEIPVYSLVVDKNGPKFKETNPEEAHAVEMKLPGGASMAEETKDGRVLLHYYGFSMQLFATSISFVAERPVQDKTGLMGRYDMTLPNPARMATSPTGPQEGGMAADSGPSVFEVVQGLGLKLEPAKGQVETLVIDHVERPSEN
jgi:bla regulator protein BlaR1